MRRYKYVILGLWLMLGAGLTKAFAQQQAMFSQYMFNGLAINPAYAGSHEGLSLTGLAREQWTGIEGAPSTQTLSAHAPVHHDRIGLGLLVMHDKIGITDQTGVYASYAYRIRFQQNSTLSMGLQAGVSHFNSRFSRVSTTDPAFANQDVSEVHPNFGVGLYYYTDRFYLGASVPQLGKNIFTSNEQYTHLNQVRHYFFTAGYVLDLNESLKLKPNMLIKAVEGAPVELDLNANLLIKDILWVGLSWRSFDSIDGLLQLKLSDKLQLGYAYDFITTSDLRTVYTGSHELMINFRLGSSGSKIVTPRYF